MIVDYQESIANQQQYEAYGSATESTSTLRKNYAYTAYGLDQRTGLYYAKARYYRSDLGRFLTQDTYRGNPWQPWTQNLYSYVGNNPVNYTDPTGHNPLLIGLAVGAIVKAGLYAATHDPSDTPD